MGWLIAAAVIAVFIGWAMRSANQTLAAVNIEPMLREARILLWLRQLEKAEARFQELSAYRAHPRAAVVLAYHSLLNRMRGDGFGAMQLSRRAIKKQPECFEAYAALSLALLTLGELITAFEAYTVSRSLMPSDAEGHMLRLQLHMLFVEMVLNGQEDSEGVRLKHVMTPLVTGTILLLDGNPEHGFAQFRKDGGWLARVGEAMCEDPYGSNDAAIEQWTVLLETAPSTGGAELPSLQYLVDHAERDGQGEAADANAAQTAK